MSYVDPVLQHIRSLHQRIQEMEAQAAQPAPPEINLTITMPPLDVHVSNDVQPTPVHVSNDVSAPDVHVAAPPPASVRVNVPATGGAKHVTFERDNDGRIKTAKVTDG